MNHPLLRFAAFGSILNQRAFSFSQDFNHPERIDDLSVFDGGQSSGRIRQASAELAQVKEMLRKATLGIGLEVDQARLAHEEAIERLTVSARAVARAEECAC